MLKKCAKCEAEKDISDFGKNKAMPDSKERSCKDCLTAYRKAYSEKNKERILAYGRAHYRKHRARYAEYDKSRNVNQKARAEYERDYRAKHKKPK